MTSHERNGVSNHRDNSAVSSTSAACWSWSQSLGRMRAYVTGPLWRRIHQWPVDCRHTGPVARKAFPCHDVFMCVTVAWYTLNISRIWEAYPAKNGCYTWYQSEEFYNKSLILIWKITKRHRKEPVGYWLKNKGYYVCVSHNLYVIYSLEAVFSTSWHIPVFSVQHWKPGCVMII